MLPTFLLIGGTKCGTTSLYEWLSGHPSVFMAEKETRYFSEGSGRRADRRLFPTPHNHHRGLDWYESRFEGAEGAEAIGDASNAYTRAPVYPGVPERIHAILPDVRLVYLVRHPVRRIESHYRHRLVMGTEWRPADEALRADPSYVAVSSYGAQLQRYRRLFSAEQILVVRSEALFADPVCWLPRIEAFVGVRTPAEPALPAGNVTAERRALPAALRPIGRVPALRPLLPRLPGLLSAARLSRLGPTGDEPDFALSPSTAAELRDRLAVDRDLLTRLAGPGVADWSLDG